MTTETITRARYMSGEITFHDYYGALVELLGEDALRAALPLSRQGIPPARAGTARTPSEWRELLEDDEHLNNVPLRQWDRLDYFVRGRAARSMNAVAAITGSRAWSLSDSVCVLKETARRYAAVQS